MNCKNLEEAVKEACKEDTLAEALTHICVWENERAVSIARVQPQFDTFFGICIQRVLEKYEQKK